MAYELVKAESVASMREVAGDFLMRDEAQHNVLLGILGTLDQAPDYSAEPPYFAAVRDGKDIAVAAVMTPPLSPIVSLCDDPDAMRALAADLMARNRELPGVHGPVPAVRRFAEAWCALTGDQSSLVLSEHCYRLDALVEPAVDGSARRIREDDLPLLTEWQLAFEEEAVPALRDDKEQVERGLRLRLRLPPENRGMFLWEDGGEPVCMVGYGSPTPHSMRIGPVYTPPHRRGRGYAAACTAAACRYILGAGYAFVTLFTDVTNPISNHVYQKLGFFPVGDAEIYQFTR